MRTYFESYGGLIEGRTVLDMEDVVNSSTLLHANNKEDGTSVGTTPRVTFAKKISWVLLDAGIAMFI